jgi:hypothetical protein
MATIEGNHQVSPQPLGEHDDRGIGAAKREVGILLDKFGDAGPFLSERRLNIKAAQPAQECGLDGGAKMAAREVCDFGNDQSWNHQ